ncbi:hypothetical protein [Streptomyces sp. S465]|uniref:hypothetical protein n=1 Tax=Streptomyces sp. S465 TaxID=2979468 RepID=UPI0022A86BCE|nr:hypothetical protein [Streptomyces sp. S465]WAP56576.1 hypothetical protein N6H00_17285 [Streptomyces sp. S465]
MAEDHRYSWLDDSAAERLLRGEPVEGQPMAPDGRGDQSYAEAERLAAVLSAVADAARPTARADASPLPGEEAAVAAFRAARAEAEAVAGMGTVRRLCRIRRLKERQPRLRRPLRAGMVAAVAGCALSGFAVAAAAGVLPTPFGQSDGTPGPSVSMSGTGPGGVSARPEISKDGGTTTPDPSGSSDNDASDVGANGAQGGAASSHPGDDGGNKGQHKGENKGNSGENEGKGNSGKTENPSSNGNAGVPQWALDVCTRYLASESGTGADLDEKSLKKLTKAAGGASAIHGYCTEILAGDSGGGPRTDTGSDGTDTGSGGGDDAGNDEGGGDSAAPPPPPDTTDTPSDPGTGSGSGTDSGSGSGSTPSTPGDSVTSTDPVTSTGSSASADPTTSG